MSNRVNRIGIIVTSVLLGGTIVAGALVGQAACARSLTPQGETALQEAGITGVDVSFKGREAYLNGSGKTQAELEQARGVVESVHGVRWAKISGDGAPTSTSTSSPTPTSASATPTPEPSPTASPTPTAVLPQLSVTTGSSGVVLTGTVPSQAEADALVAGAERVFGQPVDNRLSIDPLCQQQDWVGDLGNALATAPPISGGSLQANAQGLTIAGTVDSDADLAGLNQALGNVRTPLTNSVSVKAPEPAPVLTQAEIDQINAAFVNFGDGEYALNDRSRLSLDSVIPLLAKSTNSITIKGYVSSPHPAGREIPDSAQRAQSVADYLIAGGIDASRVTVEGHGADDPVASNDTAEGRLANQRATITIS